MEFVDGVLGLAHGLLQLGLKPGDVVAISALNRFLLLSAAILILAVNVQLSLHQVVVPFTLPTSQYNMKSITENKVKMAWQQPFLPKVVSVCKGVGK